MKLKFFQCYGFFIFGFIFILGCSTTSKVSTYYVNGIPTSFNHAWPTYGLPLIEYSSILRMLRSDKVEESAILYAETCLDFAIYDAKCRRPHLKGEGLQKLDEALIRVARYRQQFPRTIILSTNESDQLWINKQKAVDEFLGVFLDTNAPHSILNSNVN